MFIQGFRNNVLNFCPYKEFGVIKSCHEILIIHERNDVLIVGIKNLCY